MSDISDVLVVGPPAFKPDVVRSIFCNFGTIRDVVGVASSDAEYRAVVRFEDASAAKESLSMHDLELEAGQKLSVSFYTGPSLDKEAPPQKPPTQPSTAPEVQPPSVVEAKVQVEPQPSTQQNSYNDRTSRLTSREQQKRDAIERTVYVGNLPAGLNATELSRALSQACGRVVYCKIMGDGVTAARYGFVEFESTSSAQRAIQMDQHTLRGTPIRISTSNNPIVKTKSDSPFVASVSKRRALDKLEPLRQGLLKKLSGGGSRGGNAQGS